MLAKITPTRALPAHPALEEVGQIDVPPAALRHRFTLEARANAHLRAEKEEGENRVVGTANTKTPELYGWGSNVDRHVDNTGFMYLVPLELERSVLYAEVGGRIMFEQRLRVSAVVRLWDWAVHWTEDSAPAVCAFVGSWQEPCDAAALEQLQDAVHRLASGAYEGAPRVGEGYRVPQEDECFAGPVGDPPALMLVTEARARGHFIVRCHRCLRPAFRLDHHWPYQDENNRCRHHLAERVRRAPAALEVA